MTEVSEFFSNLFNPDSWPARWHCGRWTAFHGWLYIISNILIAVAYFSIPIILYYLIKKTKNKLPFQKVFWLFFLFILSCGFTHVFDALMFWFPIYRVSAIVLFITALVSCAAVAGLYKIIPSALALKSPVELEKIIAERTKQIEISNQFLLKANTELEASQKLSEKLMKQKDEFLGIVSHELKTPVTSLKGYTQVMALKSSEEDTDQKNMLLKMDTQINKLTKLINDLLDITKVEDGKLLYNIEKFRLDKLLEETIDHIQYTTTQKIIVQRNEPVSVLADHDRISQVINNLLANAIKFSSEAMEILVSLTTENNTVVCSVRDFGYGIPEDHHDAIFEKFYRINREKSYTYPGLGLGLYIVKDIILKHGGKLWLESKEGEGSTFYFSLPIQSGN